MVRSLSALGEKLQSRSTRLGLALAIGYSLSLVGYGVQPSPLLLAPTPVALASTTLLSNADRSVYTALFAATANKDFDTADQLMGQLDNQILLGHVLADRYLTEGYAATREELVSWLENYADHPQADRIASLAKRKGATADQLAAVNDDSKPLKGDGYVFHLGRTTMPDGWYRGLRQWKNNDYKAAGDTFATVAADEKLNDWQRSAGAYWQYRSLIQQKKYSEANKALALAAEKPLTFYGQLALARQGRSMSAQAAMPYVPYVVRRDPSIQRAEAFAELSMKSDAEDELRGAYGRMDKSQRPALVTLAAQMGLPNLQVRLARTPGLNDSGALFASYPVPGKMVEAANDVMDPALVLAVARHESCFRSDVKSTAGAAGMMQMMPATARHVLEQAERDELSVADAGETLEPLAKRLDKEALSARLGATYLKMLTREPAVGNNLMKILAGYNAGPGAVASWDKAASKVADPLLYMESIPYAETRNYVQQVMAHYWIYQGMLGQSPDSLDELAHGQWPTIEG